MVRSTLNVSSRRIFTPAGVYRIEVAQPSNRRSFQGAGVGRKEPSVGHRGHRAPAANWRLSFGLGDSDSIYTNCASYPRIFL